MREGAARTTERASLDEATMVHAVRRLECVGALASTAPSAYHTPYVMILIQSLLEGSLVSLLLWWPEIPFPFLQRSTTIGGQCCVPAWGSCTNYHCNKVVLRLRIALEFFFVSPACRSAKPLTY
jgi:hypothetical protein